MARRRIVVVGHGAAGLCAALSAVEAARERGIDFHGTAPNAVAMLRALVFGRIAGRNAILSA